MSAGHASRHKLNPAKLEPQRGEGEDLRFRHSLLGFPSDTVFSILQCLDLADTIMCKDRTTFLDLAGCYLCAIYLRPRVRKSVPN